MPSDCEQLLAFVYSHSARHARNHAQSPQTPRQERSRATVEAILEAAAQVFERHGYAAGTTNRIAERAGVSIGSLYQYFPNKDAILVALVEQHVDEGAAVCARCSPSWTSAAAPARGAARGSSARWSSCTATARRCTGCCSRRRRGRRAAGAARRAGTCRRSRRWPRTCARSEDVEVRDPELAARLVVTVVEAVTHKLVIHPDDERTADEYVEETVELLRGYLRQASTPSSAMAGGIVAGSTS